MQPPCELRIIQVHWVRKDQPGQVETARDPIPLEHDGTDWAAEVPTYPKLDGRVYGQLAVAASDGAATPSLLRASGDGSALTLVRAADGGAWWIEKGEWQKKPGYHDAPLCRHAGEARLQVGSHLIRLRVAPTGFSAAEFEQLLDAFRNGAWQLILDARSPTRATDDRTDGGIDPVFLEAVAAFIRYAGRALDQPHRELREVREQQPIERVRPHIGTFRDLAIRGEPRLISGRGHAPSFDTPENRRLRAMCDRLRSLLRALYTGAERAADDLDQRARADVARADEIEGMIGFAKVNEGRLRRWIEGLESDLRNYPRALERLLNGNLEPSEVHWAEARLTKEADRDKRGEVGFWADLSAVNRCALEPPQRYRFVFTQQIEAIRAVFRKGVKYRIAGELKIIFKPDQHLRRGFGKVEVRRLVSVESGFEYPGFQDLVTSQIEKLRSQCARLVRKGFRTPLNRKDREDQQRDLSEARRSANRAHTASGLWSQLAATLAPLADQVSDLEKRARRLGIRKTRQTVSSGSMTYVLKPDYRGAAAAYRRAMDHVGLTSEQLDGLLRLEDLGILDLPAVYERWCLLRIVAVLRERFQLTPPPDFRDRLLGCATGGGALSLRFDGSAIRRDLLLEYQPRLPREGKRDEQCPNPDFILTASAREGQEPSGEPAHPKLVLDAKFKPFAPVTGHDPGFSLVLELDELVGRKSYHLPDNHRVFVLHPGPGSDAAKWAMDYCHYGGSHLSANAEDRKPWEEGPPDHRYGAVLLRPGVVDPLARLILMHLYLGLDNSLGAYRNRSPSFPMICPGCGGAEMLHEPPPGTRQSDHPAQGARWCSSCGRMLVWNHSSGCGTHLFKLGGDWTFHETHPLNPYNICCPYCGDYMPMPEKDGEADGFAATDHLGVPPWSR